MNFLADVIIRPVITEKATKLSEGKKKKYVFICKLSATKPQIKRAVEKLFGVKVEKVNTMIYRGKIKRRGIFIGHRPSFKKAIVTLKPGYQIDITKLTEKFISQPSK
jgi:large subunit ribosomal protein L23